MSLLLLFLFVLLPLLCNCQSLVQVNRLYAVGGISVQPSLPNFVLCGADNTIYFDNGNTLGSFGPNGEYSEYQIDVSSISANITWMNLDGSGNIWISVQDLSGFYGLYAFSPDGNTVHQINLQISAPIFWFTPSTTDSTAVWFASGSLLYYARPSGVLRTYGTAGTICGLTVGSDNNLWILGEDSYYAKVGRFNPTNGALDYFDYGIQSSCSAPTQIFNGTDGNLWYFLGGNKIQVDYTTGQMLNAFPDLSRISPSYFNLFKSIDGLNMYTFGLFEDVPELGQLNLSNGRFLRLPIQFATNSTVAYSHLPRYTNVCPNGNFGAQFQSAYGNSPLIAILEIV